ncbi:MAG: hypothetical protein ACOYOA_10605 [Saprospiraceae bacterium]
MKKSLSIIFFSIAFLLKTAAQTGLNSFSQVDSTLTYISGEGTFLTLGKGEGTKFNLLSTIQPGLQLNRFDSAGVQTNTNRMSLNLVRIALSAKGFNNRMSMGIVTDLTGVSPILEGWIGFNFLKKKLNVIFGQRQTNTNNRLAMADERYAQNMGQSIAGKSAEGTTYGGLMQNFVGATREGGLFLEANFNLNKWRIYPSASLTTGEGQNFFDAQPNTGFKYGGRVDIMPFGDFIKNNAFIAHDLYREESAKLALGIAGSYNAKAGSPMGSDNANISGIFNKSGQRDYANYRKIIADFIFKYHGFALVGEFTQASVITNNLFTNPAATEKLSASVASRFYNVGTAINLQSSYYFKNGWAIDGRFSSISAESELVSSLIQPQNWYTFGVNRFFKNNAIKIGLNTSYIEKKTSSVSTGKWSSNIAIQILM